MVPAAFSSAPDLVRDADGVNASSDLALLSSITTQVDEIARRVTDLAEQYGTSPDSAVAAELFGVERALHTAVRQLDRATKLLA
jgi:hypothetical protein